MTTLLLSSTFLLTALLAAPAEAPTAAVTFIDSAKVNAGFQKGGVLFDNGTRYAIHTSRREKPGMAEIHAQDTDIIYVLDGKATFVTGGTAVETKTVAPGEMMGKEIRGGDTRQLKKGDVIIVPAGTPHWCKEVSNPFLYYVVKVR
jgi:quercetin dioxygenase-like cupin family protein